MFSRRSRHAARRFVSCRFVSCRPMLLIGTALLAGLLLVPGCHNADEDAGLPPPAVSAGTSDMPSSLPPTPALFSAVVAAPPPPEQQVGQAPLPPRPPDSSLAARQAAGQAAPASLAPTAAAGLIVCNPVSANPALTPFGIACGRWLDLVAAGQPELGQTPFWEARGRCQGEMGRTDFRLTPAEAAPLAAMTGATHAACGTITGTPARCTLTYGLYALPGVTPVGPPLVRTGTEQQVVATLPSLARALDARLGVPAPQVPASPHLSAAELTQAVAIGNQNGPSDADLLTLSRLSARSPLAGMYYLDSRASNDQVLLTGMVKTLLTQLPANTLVVSHIGYAEPGALRAFAPRTRALIGRYPASALLAHTDVWQQRLWGDRAGEWKAAVRVCRDAPRDPYSWLTRSTTLANISEDLRQARLANDLSAADWASLHRIYTQQEAANLRATVLDPLSGHAWYALAQTATFYGDSAQAETAFQKALTLDTDKEEVYGWGLQMYQPKWGGDPASLQRVAAQAAAEKWDSANAAADIAEELNGAGFNAEGAQVLTDFIARERPIVSKFPTDTMAHWNLAAALAAQKTPASLLEATLEYRTAAHLMPNAPALHRWLADVLDQRHRSAEAVAEYRHALALDPFNASVHLALGFLFKRQQRFSEALPELRLAMRLNPRDADVHYALGEILNRQGQFKLAAAEFSEAIRMEFYSPGAWISLPGVLDQCGRYDETIQAGREADHVLVEQRMADGESEPPVHDSMADAYLHKKDWKDSLTESHAALGYNPNDACAHENLAEAYSGEGRIADARAEWQRTIALGDPQITPVARKLLAAHP